MQEPLRNLVIRNLANIVSILGVLPICILFGEHGYQYLLPLIIYNNVMDDLDGVLAAKLNIRSNIGALLDNVCDVIAHTVFVMIVGMYYFQEMGAQEAGHPCLGSICLASSLVATVAMAVRVVTRINSTSATGTGSPTNELIRHIFFVLLLTQISGYNPTPYLIAAFILHTVSMLAPFKMPYLIRSLTKSDILIGMVNVALLVAWLVPSTVPVIAAAFVATYLASFATGGFFWLRETIRRISTTETWPPNQQEL
jgi:phosphatidylserine synthase